MENDLRQTAQTPGAILSLLLLHLTTLQGLNHAAAGMGSCCELRLNLVRGEDCMDWCLVGGGDSLTYTVGCVVWKLTMPFCQAINLYTSYVRPVMPQIVLAKKRPGDEIWLPHFVRTYCGSHILSPRRNMAIIFCPTLPYFVLPFYFEIQTVGTKYWS